MAHPFEVAAYRPIISVAFGVVPRPFPLDAYALVNVTRGHAVSWVASERHKPGYVPGGIDVVVAQMAAAWSGPRLDAPDRFLAREAWQETAALLGRRDEPRWSGAVRWPHALPDRLVDRDALASGEPEGLFFATDATAGGRVYLALDEGLATGGRVARWLTRA
jgi:predicted NAD/FAD-dependent oxidoreductase